MNDRFRYEKALKNNRATIMFRGFIDEDTNFMPLLKEGNPLVVNFSSVEGINSCGVRSWVNFLKEIGEKPVFFEECPPLIVRQMNMVPSFLGKAEVLSVYVPYVCENCEHEETLLVPKEKWTQGKVEIQETIPCPTCKKGEMELDGHPQQYFAFSK